MQRGFTLIEVTIVIMIIGITAAMGIPKLVATRERAHVELATGRLHTIWNAQRLYWLEHREYAEDMEALEALPGVGHKTASVVMSQAFGRPAFPVDTHIHRLAARWGL